MTAKAKILVAGIVLLLAGAAGWRFSVAPDTAQPPARPGGAPPPTVAEAGAGGKTASADATANAPATSAEDDLETGAASASAPGRLRLLVRDSKGAPAADATVTLVDAEMKPGGVAQVGPDGITLLDLDGTYGVAVTGVAGDAPAYFPPERFAGRSEAEIDLEQGLAIEGKVVDSKGRPVAGATVWPLPQPPMPWIRGLRKHFGVQSGADGSFRIEGLPAGRFMMGLKVSITAGVFRPPPVVAHAGDTAVTLRLSPVDHLVARFLDAETGEPIGRQATISVVREDGSVAPLCTAPGPEFSVPGRGTPGEAAFDVVGQARGYLPSEPVHVEIPEGERGIAVVFRLREDPAYDAKSVRVLLHIVDDLGRPLPSVYLGGQVEARGTYELEDGRVETRLPPGEHWFTIGGAAAEEEREVPCLLKKVVVVAPAGARVEREVVLQRGAFVRLTQTDGRLNEYVFHDEDGTKYWGTSELQEEGRVWFVSRLPPGRLVLALTFSDGRQLEIPVTLKAGEVTEVSCP